MKAASAPLRLRSACNSGRCGAVIRRRPSPTLRRQTGRQSAAVLPASAPDGTARPISFPYKGMPVFSYGGASYSGSTACFPWGIRSRRGSARATRRFWKRLDRTKRFAGMDRQSAGLSRFSRRKCCLGLAGFHADAGSPPCIRAVSGREGWRTYVAPLSPPADCL